jgi:hypothetical protein
MRFIFSDPLFRGATGLPAGNKPLLIADANLPEGLPEHFHTSHYNHLYNTQRRSTTRRWIRAGHFVEP